MVGTTALIRYRRSGASRGGKPRCWGVVATVIYLFVLALVGAKAADAAPVAYVTNSGSANVSVVDTATAAVLTTISVGLTPEQIAVAPNGLRAYVANTGSNTVSVIDTATNTVTTTIPVGQRPDFLAVSPDGISVYVPNQTSNTVSVIATATNSVVGSPIPVGTSPTAAAFSPTTSPGIPTLSDGALILLLGVMAGALTLRLARRSIVSR